MRRRVSHLAQVDLDRIRQLDFRVLPREKETEREYELWASPQSPPRNPIVLPLQFDLSLTRSLASILLVEYVLVPAEHHVPRNLGTIGNNQSTIQHSSRLLSRSLSGSRARAPDRSIPRACERKEAAERRYTRRAPDTYVPLGRLATD